MKNKRKRPIVSILLLLVFLALFVYGGMNSRADAAVVEAKQAAVTLRVDSDVPSQDGSRCDATFTGSGLQPGQATTLLFEGLGKTNKGSSLDLIADSNGQVTQTVNTVETPMLGDGTYWVKLQSGANRVLDKLKVVISCG